MTTISIPSAAPATAYCGWLKTRGRKWERVVEALTADTAFAELLAYADEHAKGPHRDLAVLAVGTDPNRTRRHRTAPLAQPVQGGA